MLHKLACLLANTRVSFGPSDTVFSVCLTRLLKGPRRDGRALGSDSALDFALQFPLLAEKFWGQLDAQSVHYLRQTCRKAQQAVDELYSCEFDGGSLDHETTTRFMQLWQAGRLCRVTDLRVRCVLRMVYRSEDSASGSQIHALLLYWLAPCSCASSLLYCDVHHAPLSSLPGQPLV